MNSIKVIDALRKLHLLFNDLYLTYDERRLVIDLFSQLDSNQE